MEHKTVMQSGIGVDMFEIERMKRALMLHPNLKTRVFSADEISYADACARPAEHFATFFAAREAVVKALGIGFACGIGYADISVAHDAYGKPYPVLSPTAQKIADQAGIIKIALTLSHTHTVAVANALALTQDMIAQDVAEPSPKEKLAYSFKQARGLIDELERLDYGELTNFEARAQKNSSSTN